MNQYVIEKAKVYDLDGVHRFVFENGSLIPDIDNSDHGYSPYVFVGRKGFNWEKVPLIAIKYNESETPLLKHVKTLQDGINVMLSDFENNLQEDARNTILVLKNYDGTNSEKILLFTELLRYAVTVTQTAGWKLLK